MQATLIVEGRLPGMNEYTAAQRTNYIIGAQMKKNAQAQVTAAVLNQIRNVRFDKPVRFTYEFHEPNRKRDHDNVSGFAHKVIQDALVECHVLKNDGWNDIVSYTDMFFLNKAHPFIRVIIEEVE